MRPLSPSEAIFCPCVFVMMVLPHSFVEKIEGAISLYHSFLRKGSTAFFFPPFFDFVSRLFFPVDTSRGCSWESNQASRKTEPMLLQSVTDDPSTTLRFIVDVVQMSNHTGGIGSGQISRDRSHELLSCNAFSVTIRRSPCAFAPKMDRLVTAHPTTPKGADLQSPWWMMEDG